MRLSAIAFSALVLCACSSSAEQGAARGNGPTDQIQELVAVQGTAELNAWRAAEDGVPAEHVRIVRNVSVDGGGTVWLAVLPHYHFHPFTVLEKGGEMVKLGGFANPEVERAAELLAIRPKDGEAAREAGRTLALLADPNGAERYVVLGSPAAGDSLVLDSWRGGEPEFPRADTVFRLRDGGWISRVTVLSRQTRSYPQDWQPYTYSFFFSPEGALKSWFVRSGRPFRLGRPVEAGQRAAGEQRSSDGAGAMR